MNKEFTKKDLVTMINEPYETQYQRILTKIMEAVNWTKGDIVVCFSGGKDSALMLDMYCEVIQMFGLTHIPIKVAWANTTNETLDMNCDKKCYRCTKAQRTGCALCGFGIKFDTQRFVRLQETEPSKVAFAFKPISQGGLGYKETCEYLNEYCNTKIVIPDV